jgi:sugar phosphate isomerase/epimerase
MVPLMKSPSLRRSLACCCLILLAGTISAAGSDCRKWKAGMSVQLSSELTAGQFRRWRASGIQALELGVGRIDTETAASEAHRRSVQVRKWADQAKIEIWSMHIPYARDLDISVPDESRRLQIVHRLSELMDGYAPLKAKKFVIHGSYEIPKPIPPEERSARIAACRKSLATLARKADSMKAQLALECLPRSCLGNSSREIAILIEGIRTLGVCFDSNHFLDEKPQDFIPAIGAHIVTIHAADFDGKDEKHWLPGKGVNNWRAIVQALQDAGYRGPFMFECDGTPEEKIAVWNQIKTEGSLKRR